ncbi:hypothetical protein FACS189456_1160 [Bacteroidia bacterium]|nr:hypothetical protein FACS189456_1160 [Bacteroidia bacterium]
MKQVYVKAALMGAMVAGIAIHSCKEEEKQPQTPPPAWAQDSIACGTKHHADTLYVWNAAQHKCTATYIAPGVNQDSINCVNSGTSEWVNGGCQPKAAGVNQDSIDCVNSSTTEWVNGGCQPKASGANQDSIDCVGSGTSVWVNGVCKTPPAQATVIGNANNTCPADTVILTASATGATTYKWYNGTTPIDGETASTYVVTACGTYSAAGVNDDGEGTKSIGKPVTIALCPPAQAIVIGDAANACPTATVTLTASADGATSYKWYNGTSPINGETASTYVVTATGTYSAAGVNADGEGTKSEGIEVTITACGFLEDNFTVEASAIGTATADGESGHITDESIIGECKVRSISGTWWMLENARKEVNDGCTYPSHVSASVAGSGRLYSLNCASSACPSGWRLPTQADFVALSEWLTAHPDQWVGWNSGTALAGRGYLGNAYDEINYQGFWWSTPDGAWRVVKDETSGNYNDAASGYYIARNADIIDYTYSVRCVKSQP